MDPLGEKSHKAVDKGHTPPTSAAILRKRRDHKDYDPYEVAAHWRIDAAKAKKMGAAMPANRWGDETERKRYRPDALSDELATKLKGMTKQRGDVTIVDALPKCVGLGKARDSSLRKKILAWTHSEAGREWVRCRQQMFGDGDVADDREGGDDIHRA